MGHVWWFMLSETRLSSSRPHPTSFLFDLHISRTEPIRRNSNLLRTNAKPTPLPYTTATATGHGQAMQGCGRGPRTMPSGIVWNVDMELWRSKTEYAMFHGGPMAIRKNLKGIMVGNDKKSWTSTRRTYENTKYNETSNGVMRLIRVGFLGILEPPEQRSHSNCFSFYHSHFGNLFGTLRSSCLTLCTRRCCWS